MSSSISCLKGLKNLTLFSTWGITRRSIGQVLQYSTHEGTTDDDKITNLQRVAQQYKEIYTTKRGKEGVKEKKDPNDRRVAVPVDTSIRYLKSNAYKNTYGTEPVWVPYRRNFKGQVPPYHTRTNCVGSNGFLRTSNPCPICRDEYLILHYKNVDLLKQFISPQHGGTYPYQKTNLCRHQHDILLTAVMESKELGLLTYDVPFRTYDYDLYKPKQEGTN